MKTSIELREAVDSYKAGEAESFAQIYNLSYSYLYVCVRHIVKNQDTTDDILQETYLEICKSIQQLEDSEYFLKWAAMIANRKCIAHLKKAGKIVLAEGGEEDREDFFSTIPDDVAFIPEEIMQDREKSRLMKEIIDGLNDVQRFCIIGYYYNEQKQEEIAEELGIPVNTVKSHLSRAKVKIKEGVLELEKKKDTKLYTLAPFMLMFFAKEAEACEAAPMSGELSEALKKESGNLKKSGKAGSAVRISMKLKLIVGIIIAAAAIAGLAALLGKESGEDNRENQEAAASQEPEEEVSNAENPSEENAQAAESTPDKEATEEEDALAISGIYEELGGGRFGVIPAKKNGKYGLVSYDNEVLVPFEYDVTSFAPNDDGQTFFGKEGDYRVFDKEGKELFRTDKPIVSVSGGVVLWFEEDWEAYECEYGYVKLDGTVLYDSGEQSYPPAPGQCGAAGFSEDYAVFYSSGGEYRMDQSGDRFDLFAEREILRHPEMLEYAQGNSQIIVDGAGVDSNEFYPVGACYQGYYVDRGAADFEDTHDHFQINDIEGKESYDFTVRTLAEYAGYSYWDEPDLYWNINRFFHNGNYCYSNGTIMSVNLTKNGETTCYLLDISRQEITMDEYRNKTRNITDDTIIASKDYIEIGENTYWLFGEDEKWGYIDHGGSVIATFDDASTFYQGKAMIVKDGFAHFIDEDMNLSEWKISANSVQNHFEIVSVMTDEGQKCYKIVE